MDRISSASRAFAIPELLESVLSHLPTRDLLLLQRVARLWKTTIEQSLPLRQSLFLEPTVPDTAWLLQSGRDPSETNSPQTFRIGPLAAQQVPANRIQADQLNDRKSHCFQSTLNDLLIERGHWRPLSLHERAQNGETVRLSRPRCPVLGSGLRMFLTQPPCCHLSLWLNWGRPIQIHNGEGIRFEEVLREIADSPILPYLPHIFMQLQDVVCLSDADEKQVEKLMTTSQSFDEALDDNTVDDTALERPTVGRTQGRIYMWRND